MSRKDAYLRWVSTILRASVSRRKQWVEEVLNGFREYRKSSKSFKGAAYLSDALEAGVHYELVGFVPKIEYIKVEGPTDELGVIWNTPI